MKLNEKWCERLKSLSETQTPYQVVDIEFIDGRILSGAIVFNFEEVELPNTFRFSKIKYINLSEEKKEKKEFKKLHFKEY